MLLDFRVGLLRPIHFVFVIVLFTTNSVPLVVVKQNKEQMGVFSEKTTDRFVTQNCFQDRGFGANG
jgi:hypothetical protein